MGDRAVIEIQQERGTLCLYSHSDGFYLRKILAKALERGSNRWNDEQYLARIIFNEMTKGREMDTLGYGIHVGEADDCGPDNPTIKIRWFDTSSTRYLQVGICDDNKLVNCWYTPKEWIESHYSSESND